MQPRPEPGDATPRVGVVVLDWNGGSDTLRALDSVAASTLTVDLILVDNASRAPVVEEARRRHPALRAIVNPRNLGYAGGNNVGIRRAIEGGADYVLVLNNDAFVRPDAIAELVACARRHPDAAAVGAKILRADDPSRLWLAWGEIDYRQSLVRLVGADAPDGRAFAVEREVPWVSGCAVLLTRRALERVGGFDEEMFAYHEEVDWCARAREQGFAIVYAPRAVVLHRGQASSGSGAYVSRRQYLTARNMVRFVARHGSPAERAKFFAFLFATLPAQYARRLLTGEQQGVVLKMRGVRDALLGRPIPRAELGLDD